MSLSFSVSGSFDRTRRFLDYVRYGKMFDRLDALGQEGVSALQAFTPVESGATAAAWSYRIEDDGGLLRIIWTNSNIVNGFSVAAGLQFGHGTGTGGYVVGRDYINPAIRPIFDRIANDVWKAVTSA